MALFGGLALLIFAIALLFDYARMRIVIEDRRSAVGALTASLRMIRAWPGRILAAQGIFWLLLVLWMAVRNMIDAQLLLDIRTATLVSHVLIAGEIFLKLGLVATQGAIYQSVLASAGWVARADQRWPDEPGAPIAGPDGPRLPL